MKPLAAHACARPLTAPSTMTLLEQPNRARCAINCRIHCSLMERARSRSSAGYCPATLPLDSLVGSLAARPIASIGPRSPVSSVGAARRSCLRGSGSGSTLLLLHFGPLHRAGLGRGLSRLCLAALRGGCRLLAVQFIYTFARHLLNQQFGEGPYQRINAVR